MAELTATGASRAGIAAQLGITGWQVRGDQHAQGLTSNRPEAGHGRRNQVARLVAEAGGQLTARQVAEQTGLSIPGARAALKALGITPMRPGRDTAAIEARRARVAELLAADPRPTRQAIADELGVSVHAIANDVAVARKVTA